MKAVLVLDKMPEKCEDCDLFYTGDFGRSCQLIDIKNHTKPSYCPLKELPEREINYHVTDADIESLRFDYEATPAYMTGHEDGWNECLDAIEERKD